MNDRTDMKHFFWIAISVTQLLTPPMATAQDNPVTAYRQVLTSVKTGIHKETVKITPATAGVPKDVAWSVTKKVLHGGKQEGVDLITIDFFWTKRSGHNAAGRNYDADKHPRT